MKERVSYIAYRREPSDEDNYYNVGKFFETATEAAEFFGIQRAGVLQVGVSTHAIRGIQPDTWMIFHEKVKVVDVESELERRI
jgi:hypothetical protein